MADSKKLENLNVVFFESRLAKTMGELIALQGGTPFSAPSMKELPLENNAEAFRFAEKLFKGEVDILILLTGVGTRILVAALETRYERRQILEALKKTTIVPRGPKPIRALRELEVPFAMEVPEPNTWREILATLDAHSGQISLKDRLVAVQEYGVSNPELLAGLRDRGARLMSVPVYRWALPDDTGPLKKAIEEIVAGKMQVAVFTTAVQIEHALKVAGELGLEQKLKDAFKKMAVASVGPDCTESLMANGVSVDIQPASTKMGPLIVETAARAGQVLEKKGLKC